VAAARKGRKGTVRSDPKMIPRRTARTQPMIESRRVVRIPSSSHVG